MTHFPRTFVLFFANPLDRIPLFWWWKERKGLLPLTVGHNGVCFAGLSEKGHDFVDTESVRDTRVSEGQVLGHLF
jgi:hypothetical protein